MYLRYVLPLLITSIISASETCVMKQHVDTIVVPKGEFLLCTNSGNSGVDCAVFAVENAVCL